MSKLGRLSPRAEIEARARVAGDAAKWLETHEACILPFGQPIMWKKNNLKRIKKSTKLA